jgi:cytochrome c553
MQKLFFYSMNNLKSYCLKLPYEPTLQGMVKDVMEKQLMVLYKKKQSLSEKKVHHAYTSFISKNDMVGLSKYLKRQKITFTIDKNKTVLKR